MDVYIVIAYSSYTSWDTMDEHDIIGVFSDLEKAEIFGNEYLKSDEKDFDKINIQKYQVK